MSQGHTRRILTSPLIDAHTLYQLARTPTPSTDTDTVTTRIYQLSASPVTLGVTSH